MMRARAIVAGTAVVLGLAFGFLANAEAAAPVSLTETGSTLLYPLFRAWITDYRAAMPAVRLTAAATGSTAGVDGAIAGAVRIGASDAYMTDEQVDAHPTIVNIPLAISAQTVNFNLPGLDGTKLHLSGPVVAGIYAGTITSWDASDIATLNPGIHLPHHAIVPIHRADGSGDTFMFTQFLSFSTPSWDGGPSAGTSVAWPSVPGAVTATGNNGMIAAAHAHPYSIAYVGTSFERDVAVAGLGTAALENQDGAFLMPTPAAVLAGASTLDPRTPADERLTLVFAPGRDSYPIISYEYAVVSTQQPNPATASALRGFLTWAIDERGGNAPERLDRLHFIPLPEFVRALSLNQIAKIH